MLSDDPHIVRLMDVKQGQNKEGKTVLYLVFEYMDTDLMIFHSIFLCDWAKYSSSNRQKLDVPTMQGCCFLPWSWNLAQDSLEHSLFRLRNTLEILTLWYRAPEVLLGATHYSMPVVVWSVGCIFGRQPVQTVSLGVPKSLNIRRSCCSSESP
ncbi:putative protein-serine/threonine kinase CMGC-CDK-Pl family [Lupinus albus]|uniref:Protein kinase domain-containing protein n=1 Tax=Lupinus albus TaxID=3870 RepID=A0A6A4R2Z9_LUPAL|nr:putative protein-serine/threonine kinase CMGC-CDK-Pl family [Lupinus albus]